MRKHDYCVIGLGRFGTAIIETLVAEGHAVMALDKSRELINNVAPVVAYSAALDSTDDEALVGVGIKEMDHVIVAIGNDIEASIMTCALLLDLGVENITAKAVNSRHERVLKSLGIKNVVRPETQSGRRTAIQIMHSFFGEFVSVSKDHSIVQIELKNEALTGIELKNLDLRDKGVNVVAINRKGKLSIPTGESKLDLGDILIIIGENFDITAIEGYIYNTNEK
jgi:trk system potassium uptake protein TrkA